MTHEAPHRLLIKEFESCSLTPYRCSAGVPTIGYGTTVYPNGRKVTMFDPAITQAQAEAIFDHTVRQFEAGVKADLKRATSDQQYSALVCFAYNLGLAALESSTLMKLHNAGIDALRVSQEFPKWRFEKVNGASKPSWGLLRRRLTEAHLYTTGEIKTKWSRSDYLRLL